MVAEKTDYTFERLGSRARGQKIERCPRCGRRGRVTRYTDGSSLCIHTEVVRPWGIEVIDHCELQKRETP